MLGNWWQSIVVDELVGVVAGGGVVGHWFLATCAFKESLFRED